MIKYIKQLDIKGESTTQQMHVIRLQNSNVEEMEKIMSQLISQMNNVAVQAPKKGGTPPSKAMVVSDIERNALIVLATAEQMKNIRETVRKIDIPKVQVYVKARIVEINTNLAEQIGLRYGFEAGAITSQGLFSAAANMGASSLMVSPTLLGFLNTQTVSYSGDTVVTTDERAFEFDSGISEVFALGAKIDLLKQNGAAHILSEPSVLCTNNKEASVQVGQTQSILTQAQQSTQGQGNIINNYSREDIGITLKVKPRLSSNNQVTLEVEAEIEDILPGSSASADRPTTTKRKVTTNAIVNNGETIILGGLIKSSGGKNTTKVPVLGDIPILGELFTSNSNMDTKVNVVIYLTPYIVRESGDLKRLREALNELESIQTKYNAFVRKGLNREAGYEEDEVMSTVPASRRIQRKPKSNLSILEEEA
jgi:general secretion pathway protein D